MTDLQETFHWEVVSAISGRRDLLMVFEQNLLFFSWGKKNKNLCEFINQISTAVTGDVIRNEDRVWFLVP